MTEAEEFAAGVRRQVLSTFGVKDWQAGLAPVPWYGRLWRRLTFAYRRGAAVDWEPYNAAEAECRARDEMFRAGLPGRMHEAADEVNRRFADVLPEGMRFEWGPDGE